jgi:hypothetical protein
VDGRIPRRRTRPPARTLLAHNNARRHPLTHFGAPVTTGAQSDPRLRPRHLRLRLATCTITQHAAEMRHNAVSRAAPARAPVLVPSPSSTRTNACSTSAARVGNHARARAAHACEMRQGGKDHKRVCKCNGEEAVARAWECT